MPSQPVLTLQGKVVGVLVFKKLLVCKGKGPGRDTDPHELHAVVQGSFSAEKQQEVFIIWQDHISKLKKQGK